MDITGLRIHLIFINGLHIRKGTIMKLRRDRGTRNEKTEGKS